MLTFSEDVRKVISKKVLKECLKNITKSMLEEKTLVFVVTFDIEEGSMMTNAHSNWIPVYCIHDLLDRVSQAIEDHINETVEEKNEGGE